MRGGLQVTGYGLQVTDYRLQVTGYRYQNNCKPVNLPTCGPENLNQTVDCQLRVIPAGLEPATRSLEGCCSIQLSYGTR